MFLGLCDNEMASVWGIVGNIILAIRIIIPIILIVIGTVAFGKAIIADDDKEIKTAVTKLIKKAILAVLIFVLPIIVKALFNTLLPEKDRNGSWANCITMAIK